jgi:hypothetical protein
MTDNLGLMFFCVRMKVLTQGLPHFLQEEISARRVIRVPLQYSLKKEALPPEKNKEDKRIFMYQILIIDHSTLWKDSLVNNFQLSSQEFHLATGEAIQRLSVTIL